MSRFQVRQKLQKYFAAASILTFGMAISTTSLAAATLPNLKIIQNIKKL
ncbi:hypothetical protein [Nostoc flagelliforme]